MKKSRHIGNKAVVETGSKIFENSNLAFDPGSNSGCDDTFVVQPGDGDNADD